MGATRTITSAFGMTDEVWRRHAHPWSVYTRFAAIPPLVVAIWSRAWIGWWALGAVAVVMVWLWLNPRAFPPVTTPVAWASRGIAGERIWAHERERIPGHHRMALRLIAVPGVVGIVMLAWGLVRLEVWPTCTGAALMVLAQLWRIDRLAWMYDDLHRPG